MGTIVMKPAEASLAMIQVRSNNAITPYGVGDQLLDAKIEVIEPEYVWIRRNNQLEVLQLHGEKKAAGGTPKKENSKSDDSGVSKSGKDKYIVDQSVFDELLQNPEKLYSQIRATEHKKDGEVDGYRVSGIRRKSIFYKLGIKNGDVIHNVNGMSLTNLNDAMKAFESLQSSRDFNFDITRRRKNRTMEYEVR
jgi:general secretion pathway protein C